MVELRRSRRRSRSELSEDADTTGTADAVSTPSKEQTVEDAKVTTSASKQKKSSAKKDSAKKATPKSPGSSKKNSAKKTETRKSSTTTDVVVATITTDKKRKKKDDDDDKPRNELTKLMPGYTAPLQLTCSSLDKFRPAGGLQALQKQAVSTDTSTAPFCAGTAANKKHTAVMLQKTVRTGLPGSYMAAYSNFKKGNKPAVVNAAGAKWFGMRPTRGSAELDRDLALIRNRNYLDPKRFYKSSDAAGKIVQVGTVIEGAAEFYSSRLTKKQRRNNLTDEVMADPDLCTYAQKKYKKMQQTKTVAAQKWKKGQKGKR